MTAMQGSDSGWMMNFKQDIKDLRRPSQGYNSDKFTITGLLQHDKDFSIFNYLVRKAKLECILDSYVTDCTILIPSDTFLRKKYPEQFFVSINYLAAKDIVLSQILNKSVTLQMLMSSDSLRLPTKHRSGRYLSINSNYCPTTNIITINNFAKIIEGNIMLNNGIVHITDNLLFPLDCSND